jgi:hypothetical protein
MRVGHETPGAAPRRLLVMVLSAIGVAALLFAVNASTATAANDENTQRDLVVLAAPGAKRGEVGTLDDDRDPGNDDEDTDDTGNAAGTVNVNDDDTDDTGHAGGNVNVNNDDTDDTGNTGNAGGNVNVNDDDTDDTGGNVNINDDDTGDTGDGNVNLNLEGGVSTSSHISSTGTQVSSSGTAQFFAVPGGIVIVESNGTRTFVASSAPGFADASSVASTVPPAGLTGSAVQEGGVLAAAPAPAATGTGGDIDRSTTAAILAGFATVLGAGWALVGRKAVRTHNR